MEFRFKVYGYRDQILHGRWTNLTRQAVSNELLDIIGDGIPSLFRWFIRLNARDELCGSLFGFHPSFPIKYPGHAGNLIRQKTIGQYATRLPGSSILAHARPPQCDCPVWYGPPLLPLYKGQQKTTLSRWIQPKCMCIEARKHFFVKNNKDLNRGHLKT